LLGSIVPAPVPCTTCHIIPFRKPSERAFAYTQSAPSTRSARQGRAPPHIGLHSDRCVLPQMFRRRCTCPVYSPEVEDATSSRVLDNKKSINKKTILLSVISTLITHYHFLVAFSLAVLPQLIACLKINGTVTACCC